MAVEHLDLERTGRRAIVGAGGVGDPRGEGTIHGERESGDGAPKSTLVSATLVFAKAARIFMIGLELRVKIKVVIH